MAVGKSKPVGKVHIKVWPDTRGFSQELKSKLKAMAEPEFKVEIVPDLDNFRKQLKAEATAAAKSVKPKINVGGGLEKGYAAELRAKAMAAAEKINPKIVHTPVLEKGYLKNLRAMTKADGVEQQILHRPSLAPHYKRDLRQVSRDATEGIEPKIAYTASLKGAFARDLKDMATKATAKSHPVLRFAPGLKKGFRAELMALAKAAAESIKPNVEYGVTVKARDQQRIDEFWKSFSRQTRGPNIINLEAEKLERDTRKSRINIAAINRGLRKTSLFLDRQSERSSALADSVGRGLGEGSRNDFLNFFGRRMGSLVRTASAPLSALAGILKGVTNGMDVFTKSMSKGLGFATSFGKGAASAFAGITQSIVSLVAGLLAIGISFGLLGAIVPVVTMLAGAVAALAGSITIGLIGALAPLVPLLAAVAFGFGVAATAFIPLIEDIKNGRGHFADAKREVDNLMGSIKDLSRDAAPAIGRLATSFVKAGDALVESFSPAVVRVFSDLDRKLNSPSMDKFYDRWKTQMPRIFENFGKGLNSLSVALIAFFAPVLDLAEDMSKAFKDNMDRFSKWARSAEGQNSIADFFDKAKDRASKLWDILKNVGVAIWNIFDIGDEQAGNDILSYLERVTEKLKDWTKKPTKLSDLVDMGADPGTAKAAGIPGVERNQQSGLEKFMADVKAFSKNMKDAATEVGKFFRELNKPENRERANELGEALSTLSSYLTELAEAISFINGIEFTPWNLAGTLPIFSIDWGKIGQDFKQKAADIGTGIIDGIISGLTGAPGRILMFIMAIPLLIINTIKAMLGIHSPSRVMVEIMMDVAAGIIQGLLAIPAMILFAILAIPKAIIDGIINGLAGLNGQLTATLVSAFTSANALAVTFVTDMVSTVATLPARAGSAAAGLKTKLEYVAREAKRAVQREVNSMINSSVSSLRTLPGKANAAVAPLAGRMSARGREAMSGLNAAIVAGRGVAAASAGRIPSSISSAVGGMSGLLVGAGQQAVNGLINGINSRLGAARAAAAGLAAVVSSVASLKLRIQSPSRVFMGIGRYVSEGLALGIDRSRYLAVRSVGTMADSMVNGVVSMTTSLNDAIADNLGNAEMEAMTNLNGQWSKMTSTLHDLRKEAEATSAATGMMDSFTAETALTRSGAAAASRVGVDLTSSTAASTGDTYIANVDASNNDSNDPEDIADAILFGMRSTRLGSRAMAGGY